jgi:hypothetical protein
VAGGRFLLVGMQRRCRIYRHLLEKSGIAESVASITEESEVDQLSIRGAISIARRAGILG